MKAGRGQLFALRARACSVSGGRGGLGASDRRHRPSGASATSAPAYRKGARIHRAWRSVVLRDELVFGLRSRRSSSNRYPHLSCCSRHHRCATSVLHEHRR